MTIKRYVTKNKIPLKIAIKTIKYLDIKLTKNKRTP